MGPPPRNGTSSVTDEGEAPLWRFPARQSFRVFQPTGGGVQPQLCGLRRPVSYSHSKAGALQPQLPFVSHITVGGQFSTTLHAGGGPGGGKDNRGS